MKVVKASLFGKIQAFKFAYNPLGPARLAVHIYYIDGLLIDTGQRRMTAEIMDQLKGLPVEQIFITHYHEDHTGNVAALQKYFDCPVYASAKCCEVMKAPPAISWAQYIFWGDRPAFTGMTPVGDYLKTPHHHFQLIAVPGHTDDMMVLYEPEQGWLFSADLYVNFYINFMLKSESIATQITSIKKVLPLDFDYLLCAHNPQQTKAKRKLERKLEFLENFQGEVKYWHEQGHSARQIFRKMKLKEEWLVRLLSNGALSKRNMVDMVIRDL